MERRLGVMLKSAQHHLGPSSASSVSGCPLWRESSLSGCFWCGVFKGIKDASPGSLGSLLGTSWRVEKIKREAGWCQPVSLSLCCASEWQVVSQELQDHGAASDGTPKAPPFLPATPRVRLNATIPCHTLPAAPGQGGQEVSFPLWAPSPKQFLSLCQEKE